MAFIKNQLVVNTRDGVLISVLVNLRYLTFYSTMIEIVETNINGFH